MTRLGAFRGNRSLTVAAPIRAATVRERLPGSLVKSRNSVLDLVLLALLGVQCLAAQWGGELRLSIRDEPRSFHPAMADTDTAETIRYLTGGVLVRVNRSNQQLEPELATSWKIENGGKSIVFQLRPGLLFSDGKPFTADDVVYTMQVLLDPALHSPTGDAFPGGSGAVRATPRGKYEVAVVFPEPVAGVARLFDQVAIMSRNSTLKERAVLGAFRIAGNKPGSFILLARNPNYWKTERGRRLPYLDGIRIRTENSANYSTQLSSRNSTGHSSRNSSTGEVGRRFVLSNHLYVLGDFAGCAQASIQQVTFYHPYDFRRRNGCSRRWRRRRRRHQKRQQLLLRQNIGEH